MCLTRSQVLFALTVGSSTRCLQAVQFCGDTACAGLVVARINDLHPIKLELGV